jgi:nucleoside-diphosphate-sugar epimerase
MSRILITGGAGYLGSILCGKLLEEGHEVVAYDSLMYGQQSLLQYISNSNFKFVFGDVADNTDEYRELILESEFVIPLAAIVGAPATTRCQTYSKMVNYSSIVNLVDLCNSFDNSVRVIFATTNSGYGTRTGDVFCTEETPLQPISPYGIQKVDAENYLLNNYKNVITLRLATVFGVSPKMRLDLLINFSINKIINDKVLTIPKSIANNSRNYVSINDVSDCMMFCIDNFDELSLNCYNLGCDSENMTVLELSKLIVDELGGEIVLTDHYKDSDKRNYIISNKRLNDAGFIASRTIKSEIKNIAKACEMIKMRNYCRTDVRNY